MLTDLSQYEQWIPDTVPESLADLDERLRIFADKSIEIWYSPLGAGSPNPKIWILGITPGWQQMKIAYEGAIEGMRSGLDSASAAALPKPKVAFAGSMRTNLVTMLNKLGLPGHLDVDSSADLFGSQTLRTGSVLKYPVFRRGKNYTGHTPKPLNHPILLDMLDVVLAGELASIADCLVVPLGNAVETTLRYSVQRGRLDASRVLLGFPHPSGANGHRVRQFRENQVALKTAIDDWFRHIT